MIPHDWSLRRDAVIRQGLQREAAQAFETPDLLRPRRARRALRRCSQREQPKVRLRHELVQIGDLCA